MYRMCLVFCAVHIQHFNYETCMKIGRWDLLKLNEEQFMTETDTLIG